jgi:peptidoglycan/xylan/chitin deacetylase (PgdA/CDA1 family)
VILLAVGYHYISVEDQEGRAIFPVSTRSLAAQLELLGRTYEFVSREDLVSAVGGERALPERACVVTFDDGLRCQFELALPVLERLGIPAIFFLPGKPLAEGRALTVHKIHALRERLDDRRLLERLDVSAESIDPALAEAHYRYDTPEAARVKYLLNMALQPAERDRAVDALFAEEFPDEAAFCRELYMGPENIASLCGSLGAHSYGHEPLTMLSPAKLDRDLDRLGTLLEGIAGEPIHTFSYPHGTPGTVDVRVARALEAHGFVAAFTMERALNRSLEEPLLLGRLDANDAPGGKRPLDDVPQARALYFAEAVPAA